MENSLQSTNMQIESSILDFSALIFCLIYSCIDVFLFSILFNIKSTKKNNIKVIFINWISKFFMITIFPTIYIRILDIIVTISLLKLCFNNASIEKCVLAETINTITIIGPEIIISKIFDILYNESYINGIYNVKYVVSMLLSITVFRLAFLYFIKKRKIIININDNISNKNKFKIIAIGVIGCFSMFLNLIEMTTINNNFSYIIFLVQFMLLILYCYISIKDIAKITEIENQRIKISSLESHNKVLLVMYDNIRGFKHDFSNFVQSLDGYTKTQNIDGIREMSKGVLKDCISNNNLEILDPQIINDSAIYNLITNKYYLAQQKGITMNIEVMIDLNDIDISNYELCRILAILLDNAIEAAGECDKNKIVNVKFLKDLRIDRKLVIVENSYKDVNIDVDKIFEKGFSTKPKEDEHTHGIGLWNVRKILKNNHNLNLYTTKGELFSQQLEIYTIKIKEII